VNFVARLASSAATSAELSFRLTNTYASLNDGRIEAARVLHCLINSSVHWPGRAGTPTTFWRSLVSRAQSRA